MSSGFGPLRALRGILRYPARHIRWKIIAPYAVLSILLAVAGTYLVTRLVVGSLEERFNNQLAEAARVTSDSFVRRERKHLEVVRGVAFTEGVATAARAGNELALANAINPIAANAHAERVEVLDTSGARVFGSQVESASVLEYRALEDDPSDRATWSIVQSVLGGSEDSLGDKFAQIVETDDGYFLYTAGPIVENDELVGVVLVGSSLRSFLPLAKTEALADITLYDFDGTPLSSTFSDTQNEEDANLTPRDDVTRSRGSSLVVREHRKLYGREFDLLYGELVIRDESVGLYSVALPTSFLLEAGATTRWQMGTLFAVAMLAILLTGWLIAHSLTKPLFRLVTVARAVSAGDLSARVGMHAEDEVGVLAESFDEMTARLQRQHLATLRALTGAIDARDPYTLGHSVRVGQMAVALGTELGLPSDQLQHLEIGGYLHDIGKIGVRDAVLLKPAALSAEERRMIEMHPKIGLDILAPVELPAEVLQFVAGHHEKLDGTGYPAHAHSDEISIIARIASVADIYDALTTDRPYRGALPAKKALEIMKREVWDGKLDQGIVEILERLVPKWEARRRSDPALQGYRIPGWQQKAA
ncbi:MAG: HD domain-containing protein [Chloroflexi bacterium]|nr:HD domain-containing protein [Chloroflexota bacterium]